MRRQKTENRDSITARRASDEEKSTKEAGQRQQQARKSTANSRRESKEQKERCQLQAGTYEENNVSKKEVGPMTRDKDTESHRRMAAEQELKVAEEAGELQVKMGTKIEVEKQKAAELRKPGADCQEIA